MMRVAPESTVPISGYRWAPLGFQVIAALLLGCAVGAWAGDQPVARSFGTAELGRLSMLVVRALKTLAIPLVAVVVLDSLLRFDVSGRQGLRMLRICAVNAIVATTIGVTLTQALRPGDHLRALLASLASGANAPASAPSLDPLAGVEALVPASIVAPFADNAALPAALLALLLGCAVRSASARRDDRSRAFDSLRSAVHLLAEALSTRAAASNKFERPRPTKRASQSLIEPESRPLYRGRDGLPQNDTPSIETAVSCT